MPKTFFITTAIDYTNSPPHVGHAYEKVLADVIARYHRLKGENVFFLTGVDQHGQKVQQSAAKAGIPPAEFVKDITQKFIDLWKNSQELFADERPPALVYKIILLHVFSYLKREGYEERIMQLQNTLPIDPAHYSPLLGPESEELRIALLRKLISQLKQ